MPVESTPFHQKLDSLEGVFEAQTEVCVCVLFCVSVSVCIPYSPETPPPSLPPPPSAPLPASFPPSAVLLSNRSPSSFPSPALSRRASRLPLSLEAREGERVSRGGAERNRVSRKHVSRNHVSVRDRVS
jgi:hypothetical protein